MIWKKRKRKGFHKISSLRADPSAYRNFKICMFDIRTDEKKGAEQDNYL